MRKPRTEVLRHEQRCLKLIRRRRLGRTPSHGRGRRKENRNAAGPSGSER
ncbi:hypothetical protein [Microbispora rosea]